MGLEEFGVLERVPASPVGKEGGFYPTPLALPIDVACDRGALRIGNHPSSGFSWLA